MASISRHQRLLILLGLFLLGYYFQSQRRASADLHLWTGLTSGDPAFRWKDVRLTYPPKKITPLPPGGVQEFPRVQQTFGVESTADEKLRKSRQHAVKEVFFRSWKNYKRLAWKADELTPVTGKPKNNYGGWGASLVDNLDTLWIMGLKDEFDLAVSAALAIRFESSTLREINVFETTIRYLGGFLSAYDLSGDSRLLSKAIELGDMLLVAFDTRNHLPVTRWRIDKSLHSKGQEAQDNSLLAEIGSLSLEFTHLAQLTGDDRYYSAIEHITTLLTVQQPLTHLPGLWPVLLDALDANFTRHNTFTMGGMADSAYEYLPKMHFLLSGSDPRYAHMYSLFSTTALAHMIRTPNIPIENHSALIPIDIAIDSLAAPYLHEQGQHLSCFAGGMFALAGRLLSLPSHVDIGRGLTEGCLWAYSATPTGIMPELFTVTTCPLGTPCEWNETLWREGVANKVGLKGPDDPYLDKHIKAKRLPKGFTTIADRSYLLRPEAVESLFVMYRVTGEKRWVEAAWGLFENITRVAETGLAWGKVLDVTVPKEEVEIGDIMESFWMAETLKYFYLIFSEPELISLDEYVFNTEAHPFLRPAARTGAKDRASN
ncbi:glycoside hydrolase family 47 protein [Myriangium duriaei CBS 260.36]|uniref:alpha-1,2-Mannosidase n=1 Tax=Myriangium duriaei CBS 260.36 TaxID=1168546 RepID=A0A9P4J5E9_9PEZI|nr:glycoside hydrolase family 47 protein [Myriangium duriaei CBS 260.36]